jgi:acylphosphatase
MAADLVRKHVVLTGRVQGVFFRDSLRRRAQTRGVSGWARNRPDATIEAVFEGPETDVVEMLAYCREGPRHAHVETMSTMQEEPEGLSEFEIR